jgi:REP element-mobilizing transposase RayT
MYERRGMARRKRVQTPGLIRHVMSRGNGRMRIFLDDADYRKFLYILGDVADAFDVECWDYCIMPNHYHLVVRPLKRNLSAAIQHLNSKYAMWWNAAHSTVGHVFQGRFKDQIVQRERYLLALCRYIARNPVRAGLVQRPELWPWSSYQATAGLCRNPGFLSNELVLGQFGDGDLDGLRTRYVELVLGALSEDDVLEERFRSKERAIGDLKFKATILGEAKVKRSGGRGYADDLESITGDLTTPLV